ncbi:MAG: lipopolysaccharide biosynthesis protein [Pseudomonadota bacterium]
MLGGLIGISAKLATIAIVLANAAVMARLLETEDFGLMAMAMVVTGFMAIFTDLGLSTATIQRKSIDQNLISGLFFANLAIGIVIMSAAWAVAPTAALIYSDPRVTPLVMALAVIIPITALGAQHKALLSRRMAWLKLRSAEIAPAITGSLAGIALATTTDFGYWALAVGQLTGAVTATTLFWVMSGWRPSRVREWSRVRGAVSFGANLTLFSFTNWFNRNLDNALIGWRWGPTELGFYTRAYTLLMLPANLVSGPVAAAVLPALSRLQDTPERWRARLLEAMAAVFFISSGLTSLMIVVAEPLILIVYGSGWEKTVDIFSVLLFAMYGQMVSMTVSWIHISLGRAHRLAQWGGMFLPFAVLAYVLGAQHGAVGVAFAFSTIQILAVVPSVAFAAHGTPVHARTILLVAAGPILAGLAAAAVGSLAMKQMPAADGPLGLVVNLTLGSIVTVPVYSIGVVTALFLVPAYVPLRARIGTYLKDARQTTKLPIAKPPALPDDASTTL